MMLGHDSCATIDWYPAAMIDQLAPRWRPTLLFEEELPACATSASPKRKLKRCSSTHPGGGSRRDPHPLRVDRAPLARTTRRPSAATTRPSVGATQLLHF